MRQHLLGAVDIANAGIDPGGNRELTYVGSDPGPKAVVRTGLIDRSNVNSGPVANGVEIDDE